MILRHPMPSTGVGNSGSLAAESRQLILTVDLRSRRANVRLSLLNGIARRASRSARSSSVPDARALNRLSTNPLIGSTEPFSVLRWLPKPLRLQPARLVWFVATPWPCYLSAVTTWPTTGDTGSRWRSEDRTCPRSSGSIGFARTGTGNFFGLVLVKIMFFWRGAGYELENQP